MERCRRLVVLAVTLSLPVLAEEPAKAGAPPRPKPNPALVEAFKDAAGTWACTGTMENPQSPGTQLKTKSEMKITSEVDGFSYSGHYHVEKNAAMPGGMKAALHWGWDDSKGKLVEAGFDSMGSTWSGTSEGMKGDTTVWAEEGTMMGQPTKSRTTVTKKGAKELTVLFEVDNKGAWQKMGEDHCKKR